MKKLKTLALSALLSTWAFSACYALAADHTQIQENAQSKKQEQIQVNQAATQQHKRANQRSADEPQAKGQGMGVGAG